MKNKLALLFCCGCIAGICIAADKCIAAARAALLLCAEAILPTLFVFFVLSGLLVRLGLPQMLAKPLSYICRPLFGVGGEGATAVLLGLICGYPVGTVCVKNLYTDGIITKTEAERLLGFCNNAGPLFVLGTVGNVLLQNAHAGAVLWMSHLLAAATTGIVFRLYKPFDRPSPSKTAVFYAQPFGAALAQSVTAAVNSVLYVCGFTVLFAVLLALLPNRVYISGLLELTNGCRAVAMLALPMRTKLQYLSSVLGFGGVSVHLQLCGILTDTDLRKRNCLIGKILQAVLSYIYLTLLWR